MKIQQTQIHGVEQTKETITMKTICQTSMRMSPVLFIKSGSLVAASFLLVGSFLTATLVLGAEKPPRPTPPAVAPAPVAVPPAEIAKPAWANTSGTDEYGTWADLTVGEVSQRFRWIQPGTFTMSSSKAEKDAVLAPDTQSEPELDQNEIPHQVTLTQGFWLADSECTQALWQAVMGANPSFFKDSPQNPVERVSWVDCEQFLLRLNGRVSGGNFCLPSEAQWEYACRAGTTTMFSFGAKITPEQVNYHPYFPYDTQEGPFRRKTVPVKSLPPNPWGLYEMHGNVWEWCNDRFGYFSGSAERDPTGPSSGNRRVFRGGAWERYANSCRSAMRTSAPPSRARAHFGLRLAAQATP